MSEKEKSFPTLVEMEKKYKKTYEEITLRCHRLENKIYQSVQDMYETRDFFQLLGKIKKIGALVEKYKKIEREESIAYAKREAISQALYDISLTLEPRR